MATRMGDGALSREEFDALPPRRQQYELLRMIERYLDGTPNGDKLDAWHALKLRHALANLEAGMLAAAENDMALVESVAHGDVEGPDVPAQELRQLVAEVRHRFHQAEGAR